MRAILAAALLFAPSLASAVCYQHHSGVTYCTAATECPSGTVWQQSSQACLPQSSPPVPAPTEPAPTPTTCTITVEYPRTNPQGVYFYPLTPGCDLEGLRLALASAVARLLAQPPY